MIRRTAAASCLLGAATMFGAVPPAQAQPAGSAWTDARSEFTPLYQKELAAFQRKDVAAMFSDDLPETRYVDQDGATSSSAQQRQKATSDIRTIRSVSGQATPVSALSDGREAVVTVRYTFHTAVVPSDPKTRANMTSLGFDEVQVDATAVLIDQWSRTAQGWRRTLSTTAFQTSGMSDAFKAQVEARVAQRNAGASGGAGAGGGGGGQTSGAAARAQSTADTIRKADVRSQQVSDCLRGIGSGCGGR